MYGNRKVCIACTPTERCAQHVHQQKGVHSMYANRKVCTAVATSYSSAKMIHVTPDIVDVRFCDGNALNTQSDM